jgi:serine/threonine protein kinase
MRDGALNPTLDSGSGSGSSAGGRELPFEVGELLMETYRLKGRLGAGGMSVVYDGYDERLQRPVAIKAPLNNLSAPLLREGTALAAIRDPAVVTVHALGRHRGVDFLVMERVAGSTLGARMREMTTAGRLFSVDEVIEQLLSVCKALRVVHEIGIAHRDVKPDNIMIAPGERVVLMDFGLFRAEFDAKKVIAGSPEYMAPEACTGHVVAGAGHLVDLYALGIIGYEMLAGDPPFLADQVMEILVKHVNEPVPDPSCLRPDAPPALHALLRTLLAKDPAERPSTIDEVIWQLKRLRDDRSGRVPSSVLIVDDDEDVLQSMREVVARAAPGAVVTIARDGEAALTQMNGKVPSLLVVDVDLPRLNGVELCMFVRGAERGDSCRIVAVSGTARSEDLRVLAKLQVVEFVRKGSGFLRALETAITGAQVRRSGSVDSG